MAMLSEDKERLVRYIDFLDAELKDFPKFAIDKKIRKTTQGRMIPACSPARDSEEEKKTRSTKHEA